jgi:uncharacterized protein (TIGR02268 family)
MCHLVLPACFAAALTLVLLLGIPAGAQPKSSAASWSGGIRTVELSAEPGGDEPEILISPGLSTTLVFNAELLRGADGGNTVKLERRDDFTLVDLGQTTVRLIPSDALRRGDTLRLVVRFKGDGAPSSAAFTLVVHPALAERLVEVSRGTRTVAAYQQEAREARAEAEQCQNELERLRAEHDGPGGLAGLLAASQMSNMGVRSRIITEAVTRAAANALVTSEVNSYRSAERVAVEVVLEMPHGLKPWATEGATLSGRKGVELKVLTVWSSGSLVAEGKQQRVVVEAFAGKDLDPSPYVLKLWEAGTSRTVTLSGVSFP